MTTVTEIATRYGFSQFGRFAGEYRALLPRAELIVEGSKIGRLFAFHKNAAVGGACRKAVVAFVNRQVTDEPTSRIGEIARNGRRLHPSDLDQPTAIGSGASNRVSNRRKS
jgi:hypothetical protein